jgi:hypothetical protein
VDEKRKQCVHIIDSVKGTVRGNLQWMESEDDVSYDRLSEGNRSREPSVDETKCKDDISYNTLREEKRFREHSEDET